MKPVMIDKIVISLIRQYILDFAVILIMVVAALFIVFFYQVKRTEYTEAVTSSQNEVTSLKSKAEIIRYRNQVIQDGIDLDEMNTLFGSLIPEKEDYFSVILSLETLSVKSGFIITSYAINVAESNPNKLALTIQGQGSPTSFVNFLRDYNFSGGRLITVDTIDYQNKGLSDIKIAVNFYSGKYISSQNVLSDLTEKDKKIINEVQEKMTLSITGDETANVEGEYEVKQNPF